jgi:hypothetical protein
MLLDPPPPASGGAALALWNDYPRWRRDVARGQDLEVHGLAGDQCWKAWAHRRAGGCASTKYRARPSSAETHQMNTRLSTVVEPLQRTRRVQPYRASPTRRPTPTVWSQ